MNYFALLLFLMAAATQAQSFRDSQLKNPRVKAAFTEKGAALTNLLEGKGITDSNYQLFIQAFKQERLVEVWVKADASATYQPLITYPFCSTSGELGPKRREGDLQIPEGIYFIQHFNPQSNFHLSLGINYPNASDKILSDKKHPGGAIYIHGDCVTIGCIPITDDKIKELYLLAMEARHHGQQKIPVYIFPSRLDLGAPEKLAEAQPAHLNFWKNLQTVYLDFKTTHVLKKVSVLKDGNYEL